MKFKPDTRSIFFSTLSNYPQYSEAYRMGSSLFSPATSNGQFKAKYQQKYDIALKILAKGIQAERSNEQAYFQNIIADLSKGNKKTNKLLSQFKSIFSTIPFDYMAFIDLINTILLGEQQYKSVLALERARLKQLGEVVEKAKDNLGRWQKKGIKNEAQLMQAMENEYLEKHNISKFRDSTTKVFPTVDYAVSAFVNKTVKAILQSDALISQIQSLYRSGKDIYSGNIIVQIINNVIVAVQSGNRISQIIEMVLTENNSGEQALMEDVINEVIDKFSEIVINNQTETYGQKAHIAKAFKTNKDGSIELEKGSGLADALLTTEKELRKSNRFNLRDENSPVNQALEKFKRAQKQYQDSLKDTHASEDKRDQLKKAASAAKGQLSKKAREFLEKQLKGKTKEQQQVYLSKIKEQLTTSCIYVSGPSYSEIVDAINQALISGKNLTFFSGPLNLKADAVVIRYNDIELSSTIKDWGFLEEGMSQALTDSLRGFYKTFQSNLPKSGEATNFEQGKTAYYKAIESAYEDVKIAVTKENTEDEEALQQMKQVSEIMKNSIVVTETMKTFNNYYDNIGFLNGSLGPDVATQMGNIQSLFESAGVGMTDSEAEALEIAIVNCSPAALGASNKGPIEKYLSTMAGFAVFDEGSAELSIIAETASQFYLDNSPKLLHLYKLDGVYYPGSYILSRIHEKLSEAITQAQSEMQQTINNDGVHIRATATPHIIPYDAHPLGVRWQQTYDIASRDYTSIDISFMSGLVNILDKLGNLSL